MTLYEILRKKIDLLDQLEKLAIAKDEAVKNAEYDAAAQLRDQLEALDKKLKEFSQQTIPLEEVEKLLHLFRAFSERLPFGRIINALRNLPEEFDDLRPLASLIFNPIEKLP